MTKAESLVSDLEKAIAKLAEAVGLESTTINQDATIKRYEFTFELAWKLMQTVAKINGIESYGPRNAIREAAKLHLIDNPDEWMIFLTARNYTVHTYVETTALYVYGKAKEFLPQVMLFLKSVKAKL